MRQVATTVALAAFASSLVFALALPACAAKPSGVERGRALAKQYCAGCHAVEPGVASPVPDAPSFTTFGQRFPVEQLEEALAEGIMVGHEKYPMPVFQFQPDEIADFIAYLKSIQVPASTPAS